MCSVRAHSKWSLLKFTPQVYPPFETVSDGQSSISRPIAKSMCSVRAHSKQSLLKLTPRVYPQFETVSDGRSSISKPIA